MRNQYRIEGDTVFIRLDRRDGSFVETMISIDDFSKADSLRGKWCISWHGNGWGDKTVAYPYRNGKKTCIQLSRFLLDASTGIEVDHINHNTLDNRRCNLRLATRGQNEQNKHGVRSCSKTGVKNVGFSKKMNKYQVTITLNGKKIHLGFFDDIRDAEKAAIDGRRKYFTHAKENTEGAA